MNEILLLFGLLQTTWLEIISFLLAMAMVLLNIRQSAWAWLFAIASSALYAMVFYDARIYGDMALQFVFIAVSVWGLYQWLFGGPDHQGVAVSRLARRGWGLVAVTWLAAYASIALLLHAFTDSDVVHIDAFLTAGSLVAQFLLTRKTLESWHLWILIDSLYVGLYLYKHLYLTAGLYALFTVLAVLGLRVWKNSLAKQTAIS